MLKTENLFLEKDGRQILNAINLAITKGEIHALLGRNGTGKSSLAYALMGCKDYQPTSGRIIFAGKDITKMRIWKRAKLGITLAWQEPVRFDGLTVREYLKCRNKDTNVKVLLSVVGLSDEYLDRMVDNKLSGGERKRIELASVLAVQPKLAILDEIDSGIDAPSLPYIRKTLRKIKENGVSVLLVTHSEDTLDIADRASLMCAGKILKTDKPEVVREYFRKYCQPCQHLDEIDWQQVKDGFKRV